MMRFPFTEKDFEIVNRQIIHEGFFRYVNYELRHRLFKGGWTALLHREVIERSHAAALLPYDPILDQVVLLTQFRVGAIPPSKKYASDSPSREANPWLIEIVAGLLSPNETPKEVALREAEEEAGCRILELYPINDYFVSPGGSNEYIHLYCGRIDSSSIQNSYHGLEEENEDIYAFILPVEEAFEWLNQGKIKTAPALIALQWLKLNRHFLRDLWLKSA
ncbi:MAG TPA: NUDIX domain-containing protein [Gammaproteobacteria bacterium]|nr:NUDIX domain-containing protein [Gammaproteobacteria bacterium]